MVTERGGADDGQARCDVPGPMAEAREGRHHVPRGRGRRAVGDAESVEGRGRMVAGEREARLQDGLDPFRSGDARGAPRPARLALSILARAAGVAEW